MKVDDLWADDNDDEDVVKCVDGSGNCFCNILFSELIYIKIDLLVKCFHGGVCLVVSSEI